MKTNFQLALTLVVALSVPHAWGQTPSAATPQAQQTAASLTQGVVKRIDLATQRITLQHGEIKNLAMPPMTMVFRLKDASALGKLKVGDKVRFHAEEADGGLLLTRIEKETP